MYGFNIFITHLNLIITIKVVYIRACLNSVWVSQFYLNHGIETHDLMQGLSLTITILSLLMRLEFLF